MTVQWGRAFHLPLRQHRLPLFILTNQDVALKRNVCHDDTVSVNNDTVNMPVSLLRLADAFIQSVLQ